jgi:hypothetical protein
VVDRSGGWEIVTATAAALILGTLAVMGRRLRTEPISWAEHRPPPRNNPHLARSASIRLNFRKTTSAFVALAIIPAFSDFARLF